MSPQMMQQAMGALQNNPGMLNSVAQRFGMDPAQLQQMMG
jgi:hypothetical protein